MKKVGIVIWLITFCLCFTRAFVVEAAPQIEFVEETTFAFGKAEVNKKLTHTFVFKNIGDTALKIERLKAG